MAGGEVMTESLSAEEYAYMVSNEPKPSKYRNVKTTRCVDGVTRTFDSKAEAARFDQLAFGEINGVISELELQPRFPLVVNGEKVATYIADFRYMDNGRLVVEDVKSPASKTPAYNLKKKLMRALYGIEISEITR
jgi:hypothetical protein